MTASSPVLIWGVMSRRVATKEPDVAGDKPHGEEAVKTDLQSLDEESPPVREGCLSSMIGCKGHSKRNGLNIPLTEAHSFSASIRQENLTHNTIKLIDT